MRGNAEAIQIKEAADCERKCRVENSFSSLNGKLGIRWQRRKVVRCQRWSDAVGGTAKARGQHAEKQADGVQREQHKVAQHDVAGVAVERNEFAYQEGVAMEVAVVAIVPEVSGLEDVFEYAAGFTGPSGTPVIHRHKSFRHTKIIHSQGGK